MPKQLTSEDYKDLFETCFTPKEVEDWIEEKCKKKVTKKPIEELLKTVYKFSKEDDEQPSIHAIRVASPILRKYPVEELRTLIKSLENFLGKLISINKDDIISIQSTPERIMKILNKEIQPEIPAIVRTAYLKLLGIKETITSSEKQKEDHESA